MKIIKIKIGQVTSFTIYLDDVGGGTIESIYHYDEPCQIDERFNDEVDYRSYMDSINAIESLVLAHACAGVDVTAKAYVKGLETSLDALDNY